MPINNFQMLFKFSNKPISHERKFVTTRYRTSVRHPSREKPGLTENTYDECLMSELSLDVDRGLRVREEQNFGDDIKEVRNLTG